MNRNLTIFSLFLILVGLFFGLYLVTFFGLLMLLPAFLATSKPPPKPQGSSSKTPPRRIIHAPQANPEPASSQSPASPSPMGTSASAPPTQPTQTYYSGTLSYTPALFPAPMLPSLSTMGTPSMPAAPKESQRERREEGRDELVEVGTILALLKLVLG